MEITIKKKKLSIIFLLLFLFFNVIPTQATTIVSGVRYQCINDGNCELNDFVALAISISNFILGIVGSLTLLAFVYGGFLWLTSAGISERVNKGKQVIIGAVIGLFIVFGSYTIIYFVADKMGLDDPTPFTAGWGN